MSIGDALGDAEADVLRELAVGAKTRSGIKKPSAAAQKSAAIDRLLEGGLVTASSDKRATRFTITAAGQARFERLPVKAPRPRSAASPSSMATSEVMQRLEARFDRIEAKLDQLLAGSAPAPTATKVTTTAVLEVVRRLDREHRYGGVVPLPALRDALALHGLSDDAAVDRALTELERDYVVDLLVAQSPTTVAEPQRGIARPGRGLIYYVAPRGQ